MKAFKFKALALASLLAATSAHALVAVEVAGITSKDGGRTFYLKQGTPTTAMSSTTEQIKYRTVQNGFVSAEASTPKGRIVLDFTPEESAMIPQWNMFKSIAQNGAQNFGAVSGGRIYLGANYVNFTPGTWTLSSPGGMTLTVSGWSEMNWWENLNAACLPPQGSFNIGKVPCTQANGQPGYADFNERFQPLPSPPAGTPTPVTLTLKEYVPATISTTASTSISSQITFANEDVGLQGQVFAALLIDGRYYFINPDKSTVTQYRGESTFPALHTGALTSGSFVLWTALTSEDRALMRQLGAKLFVGYGTGADAPAAIADLLKADTRLPTGTQQINGQRYVLAVDANQW